MRLHSFGSLTLSQYELAHGQSATPVNVAASQIVGGGVFDADGTGKANKRLPFEVTANLSLIGTSLSNLSSQRDTLLGYLDTRGYLRAYTLAGDLRRLDCRLITVDGDITPAFPLRQDVKLTWQALGMWLGNIHGTGWTLSSGHYLDAGWTLDAGDTVYTLSGSPKTCTVTHGGNRRVTDAVVTVTVASGQPAITALTVECGDCKWSYSGSITDAGPLVVSCGAKTVRNNGADGWAYFALDPTEHTVAPWLIVEPGSNAVIVTWTGGGTGSTIEVSFAEGWQ